MKTENVKIQIAGKSSPPKNLLEAARKSLGDHYERFLLKHGEQFTPEQLVQYVTELRYDPRH